MKTNKIKRNALSVAACAFLFVTSGTALAQDTNQKPGTKQKTYEQPKDETDKHRKSGRSAMQDTTKMKQSDKMQDNKSQAGTDKSDMYLEPNKNRKVQ